MRRQDKLYFPCTHTKKKKAEMLLLSNAQMNTDSDTLHDKEAARSTCKASALVLCWGSVAESSDTRVSRAIDLYRNVPMHIYCPDKKHNKRRLDYMKRRKG